jgi:hypothetical protein
MTQTEREPHDMVVMWTVYFNPDDHPDKYVVRGWDVTEYGSRPHDVPIAVTDTLQQARQAVPRGCVRLDVAHGDEAEIVESWL